MSADNIDRRPRYTVYEITSSTYRLLDDSVTPTFQYNVGGTSSWTSLTSNIFKTEFPDCRIYLTTALGSADTVRMASGNYIPRSFVYGALNWSGDFSWETKKIMALRDTAKTTIMKEKVWTASAELAMSAQCAMLTTALTGSDNNLTFTHTAGGTYGNSITVTIATPSGSTLSITTSGTDITISPGTATTAKEVMALWWKTGAVKDLNVTCVLKAGEAGAGAMAAMVKTNLAGGLNPTDYTAINGTAGITTAVAEFYSDYDNDVRWVGYCTVPRAAIGVNADDNNTVRITFESRGGANGQLLYRKQ